MTWFYVASLIFGGGLLLPMVLGGFADSAIDLDGAELDLDVAADVEIAPGDLGAPSDGVLDMVTDGLLSFRSLVFFAAFFGGGGLVLGWFGYGTITTLITALIIGVGAAFINATLFGLVTSGSSGSMISDGQLSGRIGKVVVPIGAGHRGRIRLMLEGQPQMLSAETFETEADQVFDVGTSVVVIEIERGVARVTSTAGFGLGEEEA